MTHAFADLARNLAAGSRLALFLPVGLLRFRIDVLQLLLLFAVSAIVDLAGDFLLAIPPREFAIEGLGSELYSGALLLLAAALIAVACRQRQLALSIALVVLASLPAIQVAHYTLPLLALELGYAEAAYAVESLIVAWLVLVLVRCVAVAFSPPPSFMWLRAILGGLLLATPVWLGNALFESQAWWRGAGEELPASGELSAGSEAVLAAQSYLLDNALERLADERPGQTDLYFVAFAPHGRDDAWRDDAEAAQQAMDARWGTDGRSLVLANSPRTLVTAPFATVTNLRETLNEIGAAIEPDDDVVMLYITGPSARHERIAASQPPLTLVELGPAGLKQLLDDAGIKWRIVVVSACYAGGFVEPLADEQTLVITSSQRDAPSFGCEGRTPPGLFGKSFFEEGLAKGASFEAAFAHAKERVAARESTARYTPASDPQWSLGTQMADKLKTLRKRGGAGATVRRGTGSLPS